MFPEVCGNGGTWKQTVFNVAISEGFKHHQENTRLLPPRSSSPQSLMVHCKTQAASSPSCRAQKLDRVGQGPCHCPHPHRATGQPGPGNSSHTHPWEELGAHVSSYPSGSESQCERRTGWSWALPQDNLTYRLPRNQHRSRGLWPPGGTQRREGSGQHIQPHPPSAPFWMLHALAQSEALQRSKPECGLPRRCSW